jgi:hypothetical protein
LIQFKKLRAEIWPLNAQRRPRLYSNYL